MVYNIGVGFCPGVFAVDVGLEVSIGEVDCCAVVAQTAWVKAVFLAQFIGEVGGGQVGVCLLEVESKLVGGGL